MQNESSSSQPSANGGGIKKAARWVARMFGYKAENKFARGVWYVFATSAAIVTLYIAVALTILIVDELKDLHSDNKYRRMVNDPTYLHDYSNEYVSPYIIYHDGYPGYLYDVRLGHRTLTDVQWICKSSDGDSITVFSDGKKRGYFNRYTGQRTIPAQYEKAWIFSEGVACVMDKGILSFIGHDGKPVTDKKYPYTPLIDDYCYHNGLCLMQGDDSRCGLIDKQGNWVVVPSYAKLEYDTKGFWIVQDQEEHYGLLDAQGKLLLPTEHDYIYIDHEDNYIYVHRLDRIHQVLDLECKVVNSCNYYGVDKLTYETDEYDEFGETKMAPAHCLQYRTTDWYYGLMDTRGNIITPPYYSEINAIAPDRYFCIGPSGSVILDDKGQECGEKL